MKSAQTFKHESESSVGVADQLIKEVSESIVARNVGKRRKRHQQTQVLERRDERHTPVITVPNIEPPVISPPVIKTDEPVEAEARTERRPTLAIFCYQEADTAIGKYIHGIAPQLAEKAMDIHLFTRVAFNLTVSGVQEHVLGECESTDLLESVALFTHRVKEEFSKTFGSNGVNLTLLAHEWTGVPALLQCAKLSGAQTALSLHSLECQRADMKSEMSRKIQESEIQGLEAAQSVLIHDGSTAAAAEKLVPQCRPRIINVPQPFPADKFNSTLDPAEVKGRHLVGPVDPMILFIGNLDDAHGPDVLMKAAPAILKNNKQARFVFVGDGNLQWPLRVHARYLLLEHAVRMVGHLEGQALYELIQAADMVVVPSRFKTEEWPILAAWASKRPVVATHNIGGSMIKHEQDGVVIYSNENSCVWGVERLLFDEGLRKKLGENGHARLKELSNWNRPALQIESLMTAKQAK